MNITDLKKRLSAEILPVYFLKGQESFLIDGAIKILASLVDDDFHEFNISYFEDAENMREIIGALYTAPMFTERRVVVVKSAAGLDEGDKSRLEAYLKSPNVGAVLVFVDDTVSAENAARQQSPLHGLYKYGDVVDCMKVGDSLSEDWIISKAKEWGGKISMPAVRLLRGYTSSSMTRAMTELKKLIDYAAGREITPDDVSLLVSPDNEYKAYALTDSLTSGRNSEALKVLQSLLDRGESAASLLSLISGQYRKILEAKVSSLDDKGLMKAFGTSSAYLVTKARQLAAKYTAVELKAIVDKLHNLEFEFKSGAKDEMSVLHEAFAVLLRK